MGWTSYRATKDEAVRDCLAQADRFAEVLAHRVVGKCLWLVARHRDPQYNQEAWIGLSLIEVKGDLVYVKDLDESVGPLYWNCPLAFLDKAGKPHPESHAVKWREQVRKWHAERAARRALKPGTVIEYGNAQYELLENLGRKGWGAYMVAPHSSRGLQYRIKSHQVAEAKIVKAAT